MTPGEKVGLWALRFFCFFCIFLGCLVLEFTSGIHQKFTEQFGFISEERWNDYVVTTAAIISIVITFLLTLLISGKSEAIRWAMQICCFLVLFTGFPYLIPEQWESFEIVFGFSFAVTSSLIFIAAKRNKQ